MATFCTTCSRILYVRSRHHITATTKRHKSGNVVGHHQYCCDLVRKGDYENYLNCLLLPQEARTSAFAIRAFNVEVAQIKDLVSEKHIGLMRIQFWKETLDNIFKGTPPESPIAMELTRAHKKHKLSKHWFLRMLEARESNLTNKIYLNTSEVEEYADQAFSSPLLLLLECLGIKDVQADHVASHVGKAVGIMTLVRAVPYHAQKRQVYLPADLMMKHGVSEEDIFRGCQEQRVKDLIYDVASMAFLQLKVAREMKSSIPKHTYLALLSTVSCQLYLDALQKADFNVFDPRLQRRNSWLPLFMLLQKLRCSY